MANEVVTAMTMYHKKKKLPGPPLARIRNQPATNTKKMRARRGSVRLLNGLTSPITPVMAVIPTRIHCQASPPCEASKTAPCRLSPRREYASRRYSLRA